MLVPALVRILSLSLSTQLAIQFCIEQTRSLARLILVRFARLGQSTKLKLCRSVGAPNTISQVWFETTALRERPGQLGRCRRGTGSASRLNLTVAASLLLQLQLRLRLRLRHQPNRCASRGPPIWVEAGKIPMQVPEVLIEGASRFGGDWKRESNRNGNRVGARVKRQKLELELELEGRKTQGGALRDSFESGLSL